jgi:Tir chaperone protein (CesT) family
MLATISTTSSSSVDEYPITEMRTPAIRSPSSSPTIPAKRIVSIGEQEGTGRPLLSHFFGGRGRRSHQPRVRIGSEDELLKKNRRQIDHYLRRIGALMGKDVSLNSEGMSFFSYKKFVVVVEVPADNNQNVYIYTMVCQVLPADDRMAVLQRAMELNFMEYRTRGATLGVDGEEVNLCYSVPIAGLTLASLKTAMEDFLLTASEANELLDEAKKRTCLPEKPRQKSTSAMSFFR